MEVWPTDTDAPQALRDHLSELRNAQFRIVGRRLQVSCVVKRPSFREDESAKVPQLKIQPRFVDATALKEEIRRLDKELQAIGENTELAELDTQNVLQKQQQWMQQLADMAKLLHESAQTVIRNMK